MTASDLRRFMAKVKRDGNGCWVWTGAILRNGYGYFGMWPKTVFAHRISYSHFVGTIPPGLQIDHLCRNRACVNPGHLEAVTNQENTRRGAWGMKTHCAQGHPFNEQNTGYTAAGTRRCNACARERMAAKRAAGYIAPSRRK